jgi:hypothetical protein
VVPAGAERLADDRLEITRVDCSGSTAVAIDAGSDRARILDMTVAENVVALPQPGGGNYESARFNALRHGCCRNTRCCRGRRRTSTQRSSMRWSRNTHRKARRRSIWSKSWSYRRILVTA